MSNCTSGCPTQDHESYGACLKSKNMKVAWANSANGFDYTREKKWQADIDYFRAAKRQGINPERSDRKSVERAIEKANKTGKAA